MSRPVLLGVTALVILTASFAPRVVGQMPDFEVYWTAAIRAQAAEPLYRSDDQHYQFKYLPSFAILAIPIGAVPLPAAKTLWFALSVALLALLIGRSVTLLRAGRRKPVWLLVSLTVIVLGKFYGHELVLGQVNILLGVLIVSALHALGRGRDTLAGVLTALAVVVKPYALIFLPWLFARGGARAPAAASLGLIAVLLLPVPFYGVANTVDLHQSWWQTVTGSTAPNLLNQDNVSLAAMYAKWLEPGPAATRLAGGTSLVLLGVAVLVFVRRRGVTFPEGLEGALLLTLMPLLSPQGWDYVFLIATPAVVYVMNFEHRLPPALRVATLVALATVGLSLYDLLGREAYAAFMQLSVISVCFLVVIAALAVLRQRRIA